MKINRFKVTTPLLILTLISSSLIACQNNIGSVDNKSTTNNVITKVGVSHGDYLTKQEVETRIQQATTVINKAITHSSTGLLERSINLLLKNKDTKEYSSIRNLLTGQVDSLGSQIAENVGNDGKLKKPIINIVDNFINLHKLDKTQEVRDSLYAYSKAITSMVLASIQVDVKSPSAREDYLQELIFAQVAVCQNFAQLVYAYLSNEEGFEDMTAVPVKIRSSKYGDHVSIGIMVPYKTTVGESKLVYVIDPWLSYLKTDGEILNNEDLSYKDSKTIIKQSLNINPEGIYTDTYIGPAVAYFVEIADQFKLTDNEATALGVQTIDTLNNISNMPSAQKHTELKNLWSQSGGIGIDIDDVEGLKSVKDILIFAGFSGK